MELNENHFPSRLCPTNKVTLRNYDFWIQIAVDIDCWADKTVGNEVVTYNFN